MTQWQHAVFYREDDRNGKHKYVFQVFGNKKLSWKEDIIPDATNKDLFREDFDKLFHKLGSEGWELVQVYFGNTYPDKYFFKRSLK